MDYSGRVALAPNYHSQTRAASVCQVLASPSSLLAASVAAGETTSETRQRLLGDLAQLLVSPVISPVITSQKLSMDSLIRDCDKLAKHQSSAMNKAISAVDACIRSLDEAREKYHTSDTCTGNSLVKLSQSQEIVSEQLRELYNNVNKYGKHVEKTFKMDLRVIAESPAFDGKREELAQAIMLHFLRSGDFELARRFSLDSGAKGEECYSTWRQFEAMNDMAEQIRAAPDHRLDAAQEWAAANRAALERLGLAGLEFTLHRLRFLQLVETTGNGNKGSGGALEYARTWFPRFERDPDGHMAEITQLMGVLIYAPRVHTSPYAAMFAETRWAEGALEFASAFCAVHGVAAHSPLAVSVAAGARALPIVCKVSGILRDRSSNNNNSNTTATATATRHGMAEWSQQDELAVEVPLPDAMRFHSVFACPVSKEQASADNPPMALPCGHVVCKASLDKLARGTRPGAVASGRFKCPYCPGMATAGEAAGVHF